MIIAEGCAWITARAQVVGDFLVTAREYRRLNVSLTHGRVNVLTKVKYFLLQGRRLWLTTKSAAFGGISYTEERMTLVL